MFNILRKLKGFKSLHYSLLLVIIAVSFLLRLYKIRNPVADWHSWRQADTASVTRTFIQGGVNFLYPKYHDISSIQTGIYNPKGYRFVELPLYNLVHFALVRNIPIYSLEVWGRLLSVILSLVSEVLVYFLGRRFISKTGGILAAFFFGFMPFNVYFSRVILPEPMAVTFGLSALVLFVKFFDSKRYLFLFLSSIFFSLAMLVKPFMFFYSLPLIYLTFQKYSLRKILKDYKLLLAVDLALIPFFLWRIWINKFPQGIPHFEWAFNGDRIRFHPSFWKWIFGDRLGNLILGIWGVVPFSFGIMKVRRNALFNHFFALGMFFYIVIMATASVRHDYYQVLVIPAICLILAQGVISIWESRDLNSVFSKSLVIFSILMMLLMGGYQVKEFYKINHPEIIDAGRELDRLAFKDALVIAPYNGDTAFLYQTKRWGWPVVEDSIEKTIKKGASYFVTVNFADPDTAYVEDNYTILAKTDKYLIADLTKPRKK